MGPGAQEIPLMFQRLATAALVASFVTIGGAMSGAGHAQTASGPVRHVVIFKYKAGTTPEQIAEVTAAFRGLEKKVPGIIAFEDGVNNSSEKRNQGFTHVYLLTFKDIAARDAYLPHPDHDKFGQLLGKLKVVEDVFVIDYVPTK
jgi:hypothetical protein